LVPARRHARNRGAYAAIGLAIVAIGVAAAVALSPWNGPKPAGPQEFASAEHKAWPGKNGCDAQAVAKIAPPGKQRQRAEDCAEDAEHHREEEDNRLQARRTADATEYAAAMSRQQAFIGAWTFGIVVMALGASVWAAYAAYKAAETAEDALERADATLDHARMSAEQENRAYIAVSHIRLANATSIRRWRIEAEMRNSGQTPATNVKVLHGGDTTFFPPGRPEVLLKSQLLANDGERDIFLPGEIGMRLWRDLNVRNPATVHRLRAKTYAIYYAFDISYTDVFGKERATKQIFYCNGKRNLRRGSFTSFHVEMT
jgi:hypothetical protein